MALIDYRINPITSAEVPEVSLQTEWHTVRYDNATYPTYSYIELMEAPKNSGIISVKKYSGGYTTLSFSSSAPGANQYYIDYVNGSNKLIFLTTSVDINYIVEVSYYGAGSNMTYSTIRNIVDQTFPVGTIIPSLYFLNPESVSSTIIYQAYFLDSQKWFLCNGQAIKRGYWKTSTVGDGIFVPNPYDRLSVSVTGYISALDASNDAIVISAGYGNHGGFFGNFIQPVQSFLTHGQPVKFNFTYGGITSGTLYYIYETGGHRKLTTVAPDSITGWSAPPAIVDITGSVVGATYQIYHAMFGLGDGVSTYNLPDFRGVFLRGAGKNGTLTKANGGYYDGGVIGNILTDRLQGHWHQPYRYDAGSNTGITTGTTTNSGNLISSNVYVIREAINDGVNGTPRTGDETAPVSQSVSYLIKVA